jgi:hypothetical protein
MRMAGRMLLVSALAVGAGCEPSFPQPMPIPFCSLLYDCNAWCMPPPGEICTCKDDCNGFGYSSPVLCCQPIDMATPPMFDMAITDGGAGD